MRLKAHAKLNLTLDVMGRRDDGYHNISSVMQEISLCDEIDVFIKESDSPKIILKTQAPDIPKDETNICYQAAKTFLDAFHIKKISVKIIIYKKIPIGAGLGGGSSDAAVVLKALNRLTGVYATTEVLEQIALSVGADVPFFINGGTQLVQGIGEQMTPLSCFGTPYFILLKPQESVLTTEIYAEFDRLIAAGEIAEATYTTKKFVTALNAGNDPYCFIGNMLQPATEHNCYMVHVLCDALRELGARAVSMSGSGTAVFGLFDSYSQVLQAFKKFDLPVQTKYICVGQTK